MPTLKQIILEQFTHIINTSREIDKDLDAFGVSLDSKEYDGKYYMYVVSGNKDDVMRLVIHVLGPSAERNKTIVASQSIGENDSYDSW